MRTVIWNNYKTGNIHPRPKMWFNVVGGLGMLNGGQVFQVQATFVAGTTDIWSLQFQAARVLKCYIVILTF